MFFGSTLRTYSSVFGTLKNPNQYVLFLRRDLNLRRVDSRIWFELSVFFFFFRLFG